MVRRFARARSKPANANVGAITARRRAPIRSGSAIPSPQADRRSSSRHARKCAICNHPQRAEIEHRFLRWHSQAQIAEDFRLYDRAAVYRHVKATGLIHRRGRNLASALEPILEYDNSVRVTAGAVVKAAKYYAILQNLWKEPPRRVLVKHAYLTPSAAAALLAANNSLPKSFTDHVSPDDFLDPPASSTKPRASRVKHPASNVQPQAPSAHPSNSNRHTLAIKHRRNSLKTKAEPSS